MAPAKPVLCTPTASPSAGSPDRPSLHLREQSSSMKNRKREICTSGTVRDEDGNILIYSANDRGDRGNVGIIRSPVRASILPDYEVVSGKVRLVRVDSAGREAVLYIAKAGEVLAESSLFSSTYHFIAARSPAPIRSYVFIRKARCWPNSHATHKWPKHLWSCSSIKYLWSCSSIK